MLQVIFFPDSLSGSIKKLGNHYSAVKSFCPLLSGSEMDKIFIIKTREMYQIDDKDQIGKVSKFQINRMRGKRMTDRTRKKQQQKFLPL